MSKHSPTDSAPLQLQVWNGRTYEPRGEPPDMTWGALQTWLDTWRGKGLAWRLARADRPLKPSYRKPGNHAGYARYPDEQCKAYREWARGKGLTTVSVFAGSRYASLFDEFERREVDPADTFGPAVEEFEEA